MGSFQASATLESLQCILQHISKIHTVCMMRGEINQCHISGLWVTLVPLIIWEMWKGGGVTHIWQKQWLIFKTIWQNACYLIALQEIIFMVSFFDLHFESFFHPFFSPPKYNVLLNETDTSQAPSERINAEIIHSSSSSSQDKTMDHLSNQCWFGYVSGVEMLDMVLATVQCKKKSSIDG